MRHTNNTNGLNTLADTLTLGEGAGNLLDAEPYADEQSAELDEPDDGVEALIVHMDRTTAEHLFLRAQRLMR